MFNCFPQTSSNSQFKRRAFSAKFIRKKLVRIKEENKALMPGISISFPFTLFILTVSVLVFGLFPTIQSSDANPLLLPSDRGDGDGYLCPGTMTDSCPVKCFTTDPVCGEDGVTYWCGCADAHCAGTRVAKLGFCEVGNGGAGPVSGQALLLVHIVWLIFLGVFVLFGLL